MLTELIILKQRMLMGSCEHGDEPSFSIKDGDFLELIVLSLSQGLCSMELDYQRYMGPKKILHMINMDQNQKDGQTDKQIQ
jgi:hypothetical protein